MSNQMFKRNTPHRVLVFLSLILACNVFAAPSIPSVAPTSVAASLQPTQATVRANEGPAARAHVVSPNSNGQGIVGNFEFYNIRSTNRVGVMLTVTGLDSVMPLTDHTYHIHTHPISSDGNCSSALGHLSPNGVPDKPACNQQMPQTCQEGDLAGKHGLLPGGQKIVQSQYEDAFLKFQPENESILGRSVVIHGLDGVRLACGNITSVLDGTADTIGNPTGRASTMTHQVLLITRFCAPGQKMTHA
ncbi:Cu-Zn superoxide dismutase [Melampsora americana]|nr:Cu-Zn superoxide dismutase [Melampsora americana]